MAPIGIALIGGGIFIQEQHLPAVLASDLLSLKAIYSRSLQSAQETANLLPASHSLIELYSQDSGDGKSFQDLLQRSDITSVIIALPITNQPEYIKAALEAGKHVLSEKPTAPNAAAAKELIDWYKGIAQKNGCTWAVAENFRFIEKYAWAAAEARRLGRVTGCYVKVFYMVEPENRYYAKSPWRVKPTFVGGYIIDAGVHWAAALRQLLGGDLAETVMGFSHTATQHLPPPDSFHGILKLKSGAAGSFMCSVGSKLQASEYAISCEHGSVTITGDKVTVRSDSAKDERTFETSFGVKEEVKAWAESVVAGKPNPLQSPEESLADLEFVEAMLASAEENGKPKTLVYQI